MLALGLTPSYCLSWQQYTSCEVHDAIPSLLQVTFRGLTAGTQYRVTVLVVLKNDRPGPATTLIVSTTGGKLVWLCVGS